MKKKVFQYLVLIHVYKTSEKDGSTVKEFVETKMIIEPKFVLAKDEKEVAFKVTREIPEEYASDPDNVEIIIRNF